MAGSSAELDSELEQYCRDYFVTESFNGQNMPILSGVPKERMIAMPLYSDVRDSDVVVAAFPKAGTHWVMDIVTKILLDGDIKRADRWARPYLEMENPPSTPDGFHDAASTWEDASKLPSPRVFATHLWHENIPPLFKKNNNKIVYVWRNWKDCMVSEHNMMKKICCPPYEKYLVTLEEFIEKQTHDKAPFGWWPDHIKSYEKQVDNPNILILCYEHMKQNLSATVSQIALFLGKNLPNDTLKEITDSCTIEAAKKATPNTWFIGDGCSEKWKRLFTVAQSERVDDILEKQRGIRRPFDTGPSNES